MLNLLEGLLSSGVNLAGRELSIDGGEGLDNSTEFKALFQQLAEVDLNPEELDAQLAQFINGDGSIDIERLKVFLKEQGQIIALTPAINGAALEEMHNVEKGTNFVPEQAMTKRQGALASQLTPEGKLSQTQRLGSNELSLSLEDMVELDVDDFKNDFLRQINYGSDLMAHSKNPGVVNGDLMSELSAVESRSELGANPSNHSLPNGVAKPAFSSQNLSIPSAVGQADWADKLGDKVVWLTSQQVKSASIKISPQELGPLDINVKLSQDTATVQFSTHSLQVREVIEQAIPRLKDMMDSAGINLMDVNVSSNPSNQHAREQVKDNEGFIANEVGEENSLSVTTPLNNKPLGLVDYFA